ncbi:MAG: CtsR family transcriptional regulator [Bacillota bacterium]|jgi:transcriptional regulator CtsR
MVSLVSQIENYLKRMLDLSEDNSIEIQRSDLAEIFMCVPSQINYVLETRFNPEAGYYIETRRGGGGYIKIMKLDFDNDENLTALLNESKAKAISQSAGENLIQRLYAEDLLTEREAVILKGLMNKNMFELPVEEANYMRGRIIRWVLITLLRDDLA